MNREATGHQTGRRQLFVDMCEDTVGFGEMEWRTFRDLLVRPRSALEAYLVHGPTAGFRYSRPFGFYMGLCGILMFYLFLGGGMTGLIEAQPAPLIAKWQALSGKSRETFIDDAEGWLSLVVTPMIAICNLMLVAPFLKWWSGLDWRRSLRATNVLMCVWTVPILFLGPAPQIKSVAAYAAAAMWFAFVIAFLRSGMDLWFSRWWEGALKAVFLLLVLVLASIIGMQPAMYVALAGGAWGQ